MLFTPTGFYAVCGIASMAGALAAPFLLYSLVKKAAAGRSAWAECAALAGFGLAFCLWLLSISSGLPAA